MNTPINDPSNPQPAPGIRLRLEGAAQAITPERFEILAITAGRANGWQFDAEVLRESLGLWDGVHCFVDHAHTARSVRDIAGIIREPGWDDAAQGIRAVLEAFGPASELLSRLGRQVLSAPTLSQVGFSADILFNGRGKRVERILKIFSVDLVYNPARGGTFLRTLHQKPIELSEKGDQPMQENVISPSNDAEGLTREQFAQNAQATIAEPTLPTPITPANDPARLQLCAWALEAGLKAAQLPQPINERIHRQFAQRIFEPTELEAAIDDQRALLSALNGAHVIQGPGRVNAMFDSSDRLQAAVDDLFGNEREAHLRAVRVAPLSGIRELYLSLTGDHELHGSYHPERAQLATTADFSGLVKNALNKIVTNTWQELGRAGYDWWQNICVTEHFTSLNTITGTLVGTVSDLPTVAEGGAYTELPVGDSPETASFTKYGGYIPLTLELIDRDETRKLRAFARELASAGMRKISKLVAAIFTANAGIGPTMADGGALFNANAINAAGGHKNLLVAALSAGEWDYVSTAVYQQPMLVKNAAGAYGTGAQMGINPKFVLVPRNLQKTAMELCNGSFVKEEGFFYDNVLKGSAVPVVVPEWTDGNNWAAACDPRVAPAIFVGERFGLMPEVYIAGDELSPAVFTNDEHRLKVRHFLAVWVNDFRPLHKSNVA